MFIKINRLYNFLIKSGYQKFAITLEKIALEESEFKEKYPNIYSAWNEKKDKPLSAYLAQISRAESKGIDLSAENISSFEGIIKVLKGERQRSKFSKSEEILEALKKEGVDLITEKNIDLAFGAGLTVEEIIYLAKDKCNHTWEEKIYYADRFKKERLALFDKDTELMNFKDIDEVRDEYFSKKNKSPFALEDFYEKIKPIAIENSEVIYNSKKHIVVHSMSEEAAQYWEQSCVTVSDKGKVSSGLCSAHPDDSMFNFYNERIHSFQIITKEYETTKETPRTSFLSKNKGYNLISFSIDKNNGHVSWGDQDTVNRFNEPVEKHDLFVVLREEYGDICKAIKDYCEKDFSLEVKDLVSKKEDIVLSYDKIIEFGLSKEDYSFKNSFYKAEPLEFFKQDYIGLDENLFHKLVPEKISEMDALIFFDELLPTIKIDDDLCKKFAPKKMKELSDRDFFITSGRTKDRMKTFEFTKLIPREEVLLEARKRAESGPNSFFKYMNNFPTEIRKELIEENSIKMLEKLDPDSFLSYAMPKLKKRIDFAYYEYKFKNIDKFKDIFYKKIKGCSSRVFFKNSQYIYSDVYKELFSEKARSLSVEDFLYSTENYAKVSFVKVLDELQENITKDDLMKYRHNVSSENLAHLLKLIFENESPNLFFTHRSMYLNHIEEDNMYELDKHYASKLSPQDFFLVKYYKDFSKIAFDELKIGKVNEMSPKDFRSLPILLLKDMASGYFGNIPEIKRRIPKDLLEKIKG